MSRCLIIIENINPNLKKPDRDIISNIPENNCDVLCFSTPAPESLEQISQLGVCELFYPKSPLDNYKADDVAKWIISIIKNGHHNTILASETSFSKELCQKVSLELQADYLNSVIDISFENDRLFLKRPYYAGKCVATISSVSNKITIATIRNNTLNPKTTTKYNTRLTPSHFESNFKNQLVQDLIKNIANKISLVDANIIISGGRGVGSKENFDLIKHFAEQLGAAYGASRGAVDSGFIPEIYQIGQTGKKVSPILYIACGISGAVQHLAGIRTAKYILAINNDPNAQIFNNCDFGIVGDLFEIIPLIQNELAKLKDQNNA